MMGIMMPETRWDRSLIINIGLVASCWFISLHLKFRYCITTVARNSRLRCWNSRKRKESTQTTFEQCVLQQFTVLYPCRDIFIIFLVEGKKIYTHIYVKIQNMQITLFPVS
jgi:hypothetical protein